MASEFSEENSVASNSKINAPLVSVVTSAYNLEKYIAKTIESVLSQKINFKLELVIGEDFSKDNTKQIILDYQEKYPEIIKVLLTDKNLGITPNFIRIHNACKGKYIALLDGDDYWTDENKLQKQIDFLENNLSFAGSAHQSTVIYNNNDPSHEFGPKEDANFGVFDTISNRKFHTSSLVYRKEIWDKSGGIPPTVLVSNDRAIYPLVAIFGPIRYFKESMCVYRQTGIGISSSASVVQVETELNMIPWLKKLDKNFPYIRFKSFLHLSIYTNASKINFWSLLKHFTMFAICSFSYFPKNLRDIKFGCSQFFKKL